MVSDRFDKKSVINQHFENGLKSVQEAMLELDAYHLKLTSPSKREEQTFKQERTRQKPAAIIELVR